ncbi:hypothetical protein JCM10908_005003 [Rhodotorula pacifica]|uniref:uncharacterized protein n=1 Tax=Rhodotorula pacifica TaxID=1495444 RepID=UPI003180C81D
MSGYDSAGGASTVSYSAAQAGSSTTGGAGGGGLKRRRVNADPDFYPGAAPTTKRAQANWRAAQEQAAARQTSLQQLSAQQQQQQQQQMQQQQQQQRDIEMQQPRQAILSLATLPPEALQRYLSRYGLLDPQGLLSYHHAVFPVPPLPETLHPPLEGRQLNARKAKMTYIPAARNARILAARGAAIAGGGAGEDAASVNGQTGAGDATTGDVTANGAATTDAPAAPSSAAAATPNPPAAVPTSSSRLAAHPRVWLEPKTDDFASLSAFDNPDVVLQRLAARATQHWDKRESLKEAETLTNFMFSVRNRGRTLRATPAG